MLINILVQEFTDDKFKNAVLSSVDLKQGGSINASLDHSPNLGKVIFLARIYGPLDPLG